MSCQDITTILQSCGDFKHLQRWVVYAVLAATSRQSFSRRLGKSISLTLSGITI
jgi:hypothetical protein